MERTSEPRGYFVALNTMTDAGAWHRYRPHLNRLREIHGGRDLVSAQPLVAALGPVPNSVLTIVEHATVSQLHRLLSNPEYRALSGKLAALAFGPAWAVPGVSPPPRALPEGHEPRAYLVARYEVIDLDRLQTFLDLIERLVASHGGRFLVRLQLSDNLAGPPDGWYLSLVEFISLRHLQQGIQSSDLRDMASLRTGHGAIEYWMATARATGSAA
ncbi:MAG: DUF1330 domain-containing protein [SAR324 cluster bacterium]